jgi:acetyl esterase/lipase
MIMSKWKPGKPARTLWAAAVGVWFLAGAVAAETEPTAGRDVLRDVEYVPGGHERQKLDLYLPAKRASDERAPLIVWVHGGAWRVGSKDRCRAARFVEDGYAVASINYRLSQHAVFPAQIEDCKAAIRWLRAHAAAHGYDGRRIGVWGASAGGHLVALLGTAGDIEAFDVGPHAGISSRVQAVCDFFGPTDFSRMSRFWSTMDHDAPDSPESKLLGGPVQENKDKVRHASPITYVTKDDPPFLIVHGDKDPLVPHNQSELLYDSLKQTGVDATLYTVRGGRHGGFKDPNVPALVTEFFCKHLRD